MKTAVVTSSDKRYLPGVKALYASYLANANHMGDFYLLAHGDIEDFKEMEEKGIKILYNQDPVDSPTSCNWPVKLPAMYSRLLIPRLFSDYDRVLFLDADTIILKDINPLLDMYLGEMPCAGMLPGDHRVNNVHNNWMPYQFEQPNKFPEYKNIFAIQAGVILFHIKNWFDNNLDKEVDEALLSGIKFKFVVQGLLGYVLKGRFIPIHHKWNSRISKTQDLRDVCILHYVGGDKIIPWADPRIKYKEVWKKYYDLF